jgi:hypothetical protein
LPIVFGGPWNALPTGFTSNNMDSPYGTSLGGDTATGSAKFGDANDSITIQFSSQAGSMSYRIKGNPGSGTATQGTFTVLESSNGTSFTTLRTITNATTSDTGYSDTPAAATRYIRFIYQTKISGNIQLDKLVINGTTSNALNLAITPGTFVENAGASAASGTVSIPAALGAPLTVGLLSSDTSEVTVPASITIAAGQTSSPAFAVAAVDDPDADGSQLVTLTASAAGYTAGAVTVTVTDNEPTLNGVTPGAGNTPVNISFVNDLRSGLLGSPAIFRLGAAALVPDGLTLDPQTGILAGTILATNPAGNYPIVIERYNSLGEVVSQSFTLTLSATGASTYLDWIANQNVGSNSGFTEDADGDGLANGMENFLGTPAAVPNMGLTRISSSPGTLVFRHSRSNTPASDITAGYEWSADLNQWHLSGVSHAGSTVTTSPSAIIDAAAPANDLIEVTAAVTGTPLERIFVRIKASRP